MMSVVLFVGSPRVPSSTRSIVAGLRSRLEEAGASVTVLDPKRGEEAAPAFIDRSLKTLRAADVLVVASPVYLDLPPFKTLAWLQAVSAKWDELAGCRLSVYGISHSGYFEPIHKAVSLRAFEHLCRRMDWRWRGGIAFGGTSPIDGRPLEQTGLFGRRVRPALDALVPVLLSQHNIPRSLAKRAGRSPIPLPRRLLVWAMNRISADHESKDAV